jgi:hypothetical protein
LLLYSLRSITYSSLSFITTLCANSQISGRRVLNANIVEIRREVVKYKNRIIGLVSSNRRGLTFPGCSQGAPDDACHAVAQFGCSGAYRVAPLQVQATNGEEHALIE